MVVKYLGTKEDLERNLKVVANSGRLSRAKGKSTEIYEKNADPDKNRKFAERVVNMGHESIAEHQYISVAIDDVTPIIEHILIGSRLGAFTVKSRREVDFRNDGFYVPEFRDKDGNPHKDNEELKKMYTDHMNELFAFYGKLVDSGMKLEEARFVLPYCFHSTMNVSMDARSFVKLTRYLLYGNVSKISEAKELGERFAEIIDEQVPYMSSKIRNNPYSNNYSFDFLDDALFDGKEKNIDRNIDGVVLDYYSENPDELILTSALQEYYQLPYEKAKELLKEASNKDPEFGRKLMKVIINNNEQRELEQAVFRFEYKIPLAVRTHDERHRMQSLITPDFVPLWSLDDYERPTFRNQVQKDEYEELFRKNSKMRDEFLKRGVNENDLVYFYQAANKCNILTTINGRSLAWISRMRCCTKAQGAIRKIVNGMCDEVRKVAPLLGEGLGATCDVFGYCPEGKESCGKILSLKRKEGNDDNGK